MKRSVCLSVLALLEMVAPVLAQPQAGFGPLYGFHMGPGWGIGMHPGYGPGMMGGRPGRGMMIDLNDDGAVSAEEAAAAADFVFTAMDPDDDGAITKDEYLAIRLGPQFGFNADRQATQQQAKEDRFAAMDSDGDGTVTKEEFLAAAEAHHGAADADGDGKVTPWEFRRQNWN